MESIRGKQTASLDARTFSSLATQYDAVHVDLGTGDGRWALQLAAAHPTWLVVGVDAARENLRRASRRAPANVFFVVANALDLPAGLSDVADSLSIVFPWGSLLRSLVDTDERLLDGLQRLSRPLAGLEVYLNAGALAEQGWELQAGADVARRRLTRVGFTPQRAQTLGARDLSRLPSTWAKRLAYGRDPRAVYLRGTFAGQQVLSTEVA